MSKLWVFGDSYGEDHKRGNAEILAQQWHRLVASELNMDVVNTCLGGTGLDWLYYRWDQRRNEIAAGDLAIVLLTDIYRRWLIEHDPSCSSVLAMSMEMYDKKINPKIRRSFNHYFVHLDHGTHVPALFHNWLYNVDSLVRDQGCRVLLIPCFTCIKDLVNAAADQFPRIEMVRDRYLYDVSMRENIPELRKGVSVIDGRCNHLTPPNHHVLADKIIDWYKNHTPVTLKQGFHEGLIDGSNMGPSDLFIKPHVITAG